MGRPPEWEERLVRQIHTLGDLAQLVPHRVNKRCFLMLQNIIYVEKSEYYFRVGYGVKCLYRCMYSFDVE